MCSRSDLLQPTNKCHRVYSFIWWLLALEFFCLLGAMPDVLQTVCASLCQRPSVVCRCLSLHRLPMMRCELVALNNGVQ